MNIKWKINLLNQRIQKLACCFSNNLEGGFLLNGQSEINKSPQLIDNIISQNKHSFDYTSKLNLLKFNFPFSNRQKIKTSIFIIINPKDYHVRVCTKING